MAKFEIKRKSTRSKTLARMTGELLHKFGRQLSERIVHRHYQLYQDHIATSLQAHMHEFNGAWERFRKQEIQNLSAKEQAIFEQLRSEPLRKRSSCCALFPVMQQALIFR